MGLLKVVVDPDKNYIDNRRARVMVAPRFARTGGDFDRGEQHFIQYAEKKSTSKKQLNNSSVKK